jgi:hypothetical protein
VSTDTPRNESTVGKVYQQAVDALIAAAAERDKTAKGHSERVADYSALIGRKLGLVHEEITTLKYAASLHDIGKIAISGKILNKLGKLPLKRSPLCGPTLWLPSASWRRLKDCKRLFQSSGTTMSAGMAPDIRTV